MMEYLAASLSSAERRSTSLQQWRRSSTSGRSRGRDGSTNNNSFGCWNGVWIKGTESDGRAGENLQGVKMDGIIEQQLIDDDALTDEVAKANRPLTSDE